MVSLDFLPVIVAVAALVVGTLYIISRLNKE